VTGRGIDLRACRGCFSLRTGRLYELLLKFPFSVDTNTLKANFIVEKRILNITARVDYYLTIKQKPFVEVNVEID
jgi:hypothetical protein